MICDNSMISAYGTCELYHNLRYQRHLKSVYTNPATQVGVSVHEVFNEYCLGRNVSSLIVKQVNHLLELDARDDEKQVAIGKFQQAIAVLMETYKVDVSPNGTVLIWCHSDANADYAPRWIVRYSEIGFQLPLDERLNHLFMGRIDLIVEDPNGQLWVPELKTSGFANQPAWRNYWPIATQPKGYTWAATVHTTKPVAGAIILPVWTTTRQAQKQRYGVATMTPEIELRYTPDQLERWRASACQIMTSMASNGNPQPTGMFSGACSNSAWGQCDYYDYCFTGSEAMLEQSTEYAVWSPLQA